MRQDLLLYVCSQLLPGLTAADQWRNLARSRVLEHQLKKGVAADGSWCEHSPGYQRNATTFIRNFCEIARDTGDQDFLQDLSGFYGKMARFQNNLLRADGTLPAIGDTAINARAVSLREDEFGEADYSVGDNRSGNWFIVKGPDDFHAVFHADLRSAKHKHADDLSFVLFYRGRDWIIDPGGLNREVGNEIRDHRSRAVARQEKQ